ncbi:glycosyltransferase family 1 protein [Chlorogloeopsis sp. ULAP02]|uniref:glycosyltransferase family 4 protein n=1 Tax=Chlorogloeopsis sp. ULAP02 TaxID=3107926 RepID=UPI003136BFE5
MKVGVFLSAKLPERGGGFTFESELFDALTELAPYSAHSFVICSQEKETPQQISSVKNIDFLSFHLSFQERWRYQLARVRKFLSIKLRHPRSKFKIEGWYDDFILKYVVENGINFILYINPFYFYKSLLDLPYVTVLWDLQHQLQPYFPEVSANDEWERREKLYAVKLRRASTIITGTEAGKAEIERFYQVPTQRIRILPLPTPQFALDAPVCPDLSLLEKYNIPNNYLLYPAQFWSHKNHVGLLLAIKLLREKYNLIFPLVFIGSDRGNELYVRQMVAELELSKQVHFLGFVPQEDLMHLYRDAFALTFVSFFGPDNLPPLEAMALQCPVIASNVSGAKEQLGDAALLVDPKDVEQIALAIKSLWDDSTLRQELIQRGLKRATKWRAIDYVKGICSILDEFEPIRRCWSSKELYQQK